MEETHSERRLAENEVIFRQINEQVHKGFEETNRLAREDGQPEYITEPDENDAPLQFYCECADEKCAGRVIINLHTYNEIHKQNNRFVILPGHEVASVEDVVTKNDKYEVVQKKVEPPESSDTLHPSSLHNV